MPTQYPESSTDKAMDQHWMQLALQVARQAASIGEVPVGAVLIKDQSMITTAGNAPISTNDPTAHAEIITLRKAGNLLGNYRLSGTTLYVTLEPCIMCMGALIHARIDRLVYGATDPKSGAVESKYTIGRDQLLNHTVVVSGGVLAHESSQLLKSFFKRKRMA